MKKWNLIFYPCILILAISSCKKEETFSDTNPIDPVETEWGEGKVFRNGKLWTFGCIASASPVYPGKFSLVLNHRNENGYLRGQFHFRYFSKQIGTYFPKQYVYEFDSASDSLFTSDFFTTLSDGDVLGDQYVLLKDSAMVFTLDTIVSNGEIWGTFGGTLVKKIGEMEYDPASPDTLVFTEGEYHAKLEP